MARGADARWNEALREAFVFAPVLPGGAAGAERGAKWVTEPAAHVAARRAELTKSAGTYSRRVASDAALPRPAATARTGLVAVRAALPCPAAMERPCGSAFALEGKAVLFAKVVAAAAPEEAACEPAAGPGAVVAAAEAVAALAVAASQASAVERSEEEIRVA